MAYVAVRGGKDAIEASIQRLKYQRLKEKTSIDVEELYAAMPALIGQVMSEASLYAPELAALAIKQAMGSPEEAVFILRAYRSTVPRIYYTPEISSLSMKVERRISAAFKDIPGGQILGASTDYTHRLLDFSLLEETSPQVAQWLKEYEEKYQSLNGDSVESSSDFDEGKQAQSNDPSEFERLPKVVDYLTQQGLFKDIPMNFDPPKDVTTHALSFPSTRSERLQVLTRGQTGAVTAFGYAALRGFGGGALHATVGELRIGQLPVVIEDPLFGAEGEDDQYYIGEIQITEVEMLVPVTVNKGQGKKEIEFELGYGICYGQNETKAVAMSLLDHNLENPNPAHPSESEEFVLLHIDSVEATGFISHLKLPHYVTFQAKLDSLRKVKADQKEKETANSLAGAGEERK
jgi:alpha-D-ribose 1-methylphosphonate 5-triphosphate synthase subunit PhnI